MAFERRYNFYMIFEKFINKNNFFKRFFSIKKFFECIYASISIKNLQSYIRHLILVHASREWMLVCEIMGLFLACFNLCLWMEYIAEKIGRSRRSSNAELNILFLNFTEVKWVKKLKKCPPSQNKISCWFKVFCVLPVNKNYYSCVLF